MMILENSDKKKGLLYKPHMAGPVLRQKEVRNDRNVDEGCASGVAIMTDEGCDCDCGVEGFSVEDFDVMEFVSETTEKKQCTGYKTVANMSGIENSETQNQNDAQYGKFLFFSSDVTYSDTSYRI